MKRALTISALAGLFISTMVIGALAQNPGFNASRTFEFDPDKIGGAVAYWKNGIGETDSNCKTNFGLQLEKNAALTDVVSAGAVLNGLNGVVVLAGDTLGYDIKNTSACGAGAPRFNVYYTLPNSTSGFSFVGGCVYGTVSPAQNASWRRLTFDLQNPTQAYPPIPPGSTINAVVLIVDEPGKYTLDNIQFRGQYADKTGNSGPAPACP